MPANYHTIGGVQSVARSKGEVSAQWQSIWKDLHLFVLNDGSDGGTPGFINRIDNAVGERNFIGDTVGVAGTGWDFLGSGSSDRGAQIPDHAVYNDWPEMSWAALVEVDDWDAASWGSSGYMWNKSTWSGSTKSWRARVESASNVLAWEISNDGNSPAAGNRATVATSVLNVAPDNIPQLIVCTYNDDGSSRLAIYLDGDEVATATGETGPIFNTTNSVTFGQSSDNGGGTSDNFFGKLFAGWVWSRALRAGEIKEWWNAGVFTPFTRRLPFMSGIEAAAVSGRIMSSLVHGGGLAHSGGIAGVHGGLAG